MLGWKQLSLTSLPPVCFSFTSTPGNNIFHQQLFSVIRKLSSVTKLNIPSVLRGLQWFLVANYIKLKFPNTVHYVLNELCWVLWTICSHFPTYSNLYSLFYIIWQPCTTMINSFLVYILSHYGQDYLLSLYLFILSFLLNYRFSNFHLGT